MPANRLAETGTDLARTNRAWRSEMTRLYGADAALRFGYRRKHRGEVGTPVSHADDARRHAIASRRHARRMPS